MDFIPVSTPSISEVDVSAVSACVRDGWISSEGPQVAAFEQAFAASVEVAHGVAVSNGTAALDVALEALEIGPDDEVIMPSFTIVSCINQVLRSGAKPIFVDVSPTTWNMDPQAVADAITRNTKAIIVVHIYGLPADVDHIVELASKRGIPVVEDAAEAHGQHLNGKPLGSFGTVSTFSFYSNKLVTTGEGGMVLTSDTVLAERMRSLRNLSFEGSRRFVHHNIGWNYRMTAMQAALGLSQLGRMPELLDYKRAVGNRYQTGLADLPSVTLSAAHHRGSLNVYWVFGLVLGEEHPSNAIEIMERLREKGIGTRPFFYPLHKQPVLKKYGWADQPDLPVSEMLGDRGLYLPNGADLTEAQLDYVIDAVRDVVSG